uniref:Uncharacterized protein n=1 Tax=Tanacetum cinerariifolium TaxID=118510 RepID=A0A6L2JTX5_TANCI|nr:hypothetical protein [Tanacetum cinerariifolium]
MVFSKILKVAGGLGFGCWRRVSWCTVIKGFLGLRCSTRSSFDYLNSSIGFKPAEDKWVVWMSHEDQAV